MSILATDKKLEKKVRIEKNPEDKSWNKAGRKALLRTSTMAHLQNSAFIWRRNSQNPLSSFSGSFGFFYLSNYSTKSCNIWRPICILNSDVKKKLKMHYYHCQLLYLAFRERQVEVFILQGPQQKKFELKQCGDRIQEILTLTQLQILSQFNDPGYWYHTNVEFRENPGIFFFGNASSQLSDNDIYFIFHSYWYSTWKTGMFQNSDRKGKWWS